MNDIPEYVKQKWEQNIDLSQEEIVKIIQENPQATGLHGRVMTQLRSLREQGFLIFEGRKITITSLGNDLIDNIKDPTAIYTKAMLGLHANSIARPKILNKARPFLNTLFTIDEVNRQWEELGKEPKGILFHEFAAFVLSMKDCDYHNAAVKIIEYRQHFRFKIDREYIENYLERNNILSIEFDSLVKDYPDDVFRKFEMTGLLTKHGSYQYVYINFSKYNYSKVQTILQRYKNYKSENFSSVPDYYKFLEQQVIPWETDEFIRKKVISEKAKVLGIELNSQYTIEEKEEMLDRIFYSHALEKAVQRYDYSFITKELQILAGTKKGKSELNSISEPLRLEYLLALYFGKKYGLKGLVSNIKYNEDGEPLHCAAGGKSDILFINDCGSYILEPTMITSKAQQLNNETSNIVRHVQDEEQRTKLIYRVMMIAPKVHRDITDFFQYKADKEDVHIIPITIERAIGLFKESNILSDLGINYDQILQILLEKSPQEYSDKMNEYRVEA